MINIPDNIWYILGHNREDSLAYMCPYETKKDGAPLASTLKQQRTGTDWAGYRRKPEDVPLVSAVLVNEPTVGMYIGSSVCRWTTSNKLFRVTDPRGFTVEVPTGNIATLLHHCTVINGVVQEACVWGRDGEHILLPVNSDVYREAREKIDVKENQLIPVGQLKVGDWVQFFGEVESYQYAGKVKVTWEVSHWSKKSHYGYGYRQEEFPPVLKGTEVIEDNKWQPVFLIQRERYDYDYAKREYLNRENYMSTRTYNVDKIEKITGHSEAPVIDVAFLTQKAQNYGIPDRALKRSTLTAGIKAEIEHDRGGYRLHYSRTDKVISLQYKE